MLWGRCEQSTEGRENDPSLSNAADGSRKIKTNNVNNVKVTGTLARTVLVKGLKAKARLKWVQDKTGIKDKRE